VGEGLADSGEELHRGQLLWGGVGCGGGEDKEDDDDVKFSVRGQNEDKGQGGTRGRSGIQAILVSLMLLTMRARTLAAVAVAWWRRDWVAKDLARNILACWFWWWWVVVGLLWFVGRRVATRGRRGKEA
jgi:hypothetical protein